MKKIILFMAILCLFCVPASKAEATMTIGEVQDSINSLRVQILQFQERLNELKEIKPPTVIPVAEDISPGITVEGEASPAIPKIYFNPSSYIASEHTGVPTNVTVKVILSAISERAVTVNYKSSGGTATAGSDYQIVNGALTFAPEETSKTFTVIVLDDDLNEFNETVNLTLSSPSNATLGSPNQATLTIKDNDGPFRVSFGSPAYIKAEDGGSVLVGVKIPRTSTKIVTVDYETTNINAQAGQDYVATSGTLTFSPGETKKTFSVSILNDDIAESVETFRLKLSNPTNVDLGVPSNAIVTIIDDDALPKVSFRMFVYSKVEGNDFTVKVKLNQPSTEIITVDYGTSDGTAKAGQDYVATNGTLTFIPGDVVKSFTVKTIDDSNAEYSEVFSINLSDPVNATLGVPKNVIMIIIDDDAIPKVSFSWSNYPVKEGQKAIITVRLSKLSDKTITVNYQTSDGTAFAGSDYLSAYGTLTFKPLRLIKTFSVTTLNDNITEGYETVNLTLSNPSNAVLKVPYDATLTIKE